MTDDFIIRHDGQKFYLEAIEQPKISGYVNDSDIWFGLSQADLTTLLHMIRAAFAGRAPQAELLEDA